MAQAHIDQPKAMMGYTWPGIEYGEPPSCRFSFFEYCDAIRLGNLALFKAIEQESHGWWTSDLDRGAGSVLHIAVDHGQFECVRYLIEQRGAQVNQQDCKRGSTPLHRCARMAHHRHAPFLEIFEYLLQHGADPALKTFCGFDDLAQGTHGPPLGIMDVAVNKGRGWQAGELKQKLLEMIDGASHTSKAPPYVYSGPSIGKEAQAVMDAWSQLPKQYPPGNWRPPPPAGFLAAQGMRPAGPDPWRPAGSNDGSSFMRPMTEAELSHQSRMTAVEG